MARNNLDIEKLRENELAGAKTINPMVDWARSLASTSDYLYLSNNAYGGVNLDVDFPLLAYNILRLVERIAADFKATVDGSKLTVAGGHVFLPDRAYILADYTRNLTDGDAGDCLCINLTASSASYAWTAMPSTGIVTATGATLPLCRPFKTNGKWYVQHLHIGAYVLPFPPAAIIAGYDESKVQALTHQAAGLAWGDYCPDCSDSSSSASTSSSSSSASVSASSSSASPWGGGHLNVSDTCYDCSGFSGDYYLISGNPDDRTGVWARGDGAQIAFSVNGWHLTYGAKDVYVWNSSYPYQPDKWSGKWKTEVNCTQDACGFSGYLYVEFISSASSQNIEDELI